MSHLSKSTGRLARLALAAMGLSLAACASNPDPEINDPFEPINRGVFELNRGLDFWIFRPAAVTYRDLVPDQVKDMVRNFLDNLRSPIIVANSLLQGDLQNASDATGRFLGNTIIGVGGLFDVMPDTPKRDEDFGQTLAIWGSGEGPYLMLPVLGPSNLRDTVGLGGDFMLDPITYIALNNNLGGFEWARAIGRGVDSRSRSLQALDEIERSAIDFYATVRSLYRQRRMDEIRNGEPGPTPLPDITFDSDDDIQSKPVSSLR